MSNPDEDSAKKIPAPGENGWYSRLTPEPIEVAEAWELPHHIASAVSYLARAGHKPGIDGTIDNGAEDIKKAIWYLERYLKWKYPSDA